MPCSAGHCMAHAVHRSGMGTLSAVSLFGLPESFLGVMDQSGKALLTLAMAAIGLRIGIAKLVRTGGIAFVFGLVIFALQLGLVTLLALWWLP